MRQDHGMHAENAANTAFAKNSNHGERLEGRLGSILQIPYRHGKLLSTTIINLGVLSVLFKPQRFINILLPNFVQLSTSSLMFMLRWFYEGV